MEKDVLAMLEREEQREQKNQAKLEKRNKQLLDDANAHDEDLEEDEDGGMNDADLLKDLDDDDAAILAELEGDEDDEAQLKRLQAEDDDDDIAAGGGDHDAAEDAELNALRDDDEEPPAPGGPKPSSSSNKSPAAPASPIAPPPQSSSSQSLVGSPAVVTAAAPSVIAPAGSAADLGALNDRLKEAKMKVAQLMKAGAKDKATNALRVAKQIEARISDLEAGNLNNAPKSILADIEKQFQSIDGILQASPTSPRALPVPPTSSNNQTPLQQVNKRLEEYKRAAMRAKAAGNMDAARSAMMYIRDMKAMQTQLLEQAKANVGAVAGNQSNQKPVNMSQLPPPIGADGMPPAHRGAALKRQQSLEDRKQQAARPGSAKQAAAPAPARIEKVSAAGSGAPVYTKYGTNVPKPKRPSASKPAASPASVSHGPVQAAPPAGLQAIAFTPEMLAAARAAGAAAGLDAKAQLEYDDLLSKLNHQMLALDKRAKTALAEKDKTTTMEFLKIKKVTEKDRDMVLAALRNGFPPPAYSVESQSFSQEIRFDHIPADKLELHIDALRKLGSSSNVYVSFVFEHPSPEEAQKGQTASVKGPEAEFKFAKLLNISTHLRKTEAGSRRFNHTKLIANVVQPGFFKDSIIGSVEIKLGDLIKKAELNGPFEVRDSAKKVVGELHLSLKLQSPLGGKDLRPVEFPCVVIHEWFAKPVQQAAPATLPPIASNEPQPTANNPPSSSSTSAAASPRPSSQSVSAPAAKPADAIEQPTRPASKSASAGGGSSADLEEISPEELKDPLNPLLIVSSDVFDAEIQLTQQQIQATQIALRGAANEDAKEELQDKLSALEDRRQALDIRNQILVSHVQKGNITFPMYLEQLRKAITHDRALAVALTRALMETELKTAEENADSVE